jgi:hypothetical protein
MRRVYSAKAFMLVTLHHSDGSEQTVDVARLQLSLDGGPLKISPGRVPSTIVLESPGDDDTWYQLVISPGAANVIHLDVLPKCRSSSKSAAG